MWSTRDLGFRAIHDAAIFRLVYEVDRQRTLSSVTLRNLAPATTNVFAMQLENDDLDYGDALTAQTSLADDGARHFPIGGYLGDTWDAEPAAVINAAATGDDLDGFDDDDGVSFCWERPLPRASVIRSKRSANCHSAAWIRGRLG